MAIDRKNSQSETFRKNYTESEMKKLSGAVEQAADIIFITDKSGTIEYVNPSFERITGYSFDEVIGKNPSILKSGEMSGDYYNKVWTTILSGNPIQGEVKNRKKDGTIFYYDQIITPIKDENGVVTHFISTGRDITDRIAAVNALRESEERYNLAIAGINAGVWDWFDVRSDREWWSPRFYELLDYSDREIEPSLANFTELLHPDDRERTFGLVEKHFRDNTPFNIEYRLRTKSGEYKWFLGSGQAKRDEHGNPLRMAGSIVDINDKKTAEERLKKSELKFRAIFDQAFQYTGLLEPDGTIIEVNRTALDFGGFNIDSVRGIKFWEAPWWSWCDKTAVNLKDSIEQSSSGNFIRYETDIKGKDGSFITIDFSIKPIQDPDGNIVMLIAEGRDITEKRIIENELKNSEERMRLFIKHTPAAVAMFDNEMRYLAASSRWYHDYNIEGEDIIGKCHYEVFPEIENMPEWKEIHRRCLNGEIMTNEKDIFPRLDGRTDWIRWGIHPWMMKDGKVGGIIMFTEVITDRIENEIKINREREKAQRYLDVAGNIFVVINTEQKVELINQKGCEITGYSEDEITGKNWFDLVLPEDRREKIKNLFRELIENNVELNRYHEDVIISRNGERRIIAWNNTVIHDENGNITATLSSGNDITEKKQTEEKLLKLNEELEERVNLRTMELRYAVEALSKNEQRAMLLKEIASAANSASTADEAFQVSIEKICLYTGWPVGHVYLVSNKTGRLFSSAIWHFADTERYSAIKQISDLSEFEPGRGLPGKVLLLREPIFIPDIYADKDFIRTKMGIDPGVNRAFAFPVIVNGNVEAVLEFFTDRTGDFDSDFLAVLEQIGLQLGYVIERKRVELALRQSETKFRTIFNENIHFLLGFVSTDGILLDVNNTALSFAGASIDEVINRPFWDGPWWADSPEDRLRLIEAVKTASGGEAVNFEAIHRDNTGMLHHIDFSLTPVKNEAGEVEYLIPSGFDITERKLVLMERDNLIAEMEKRVRELNCLYRISDSIQNNQNIDEVFEYAIGVIPLSLQYPDDTAVRITYDGREYSSANFSYTRWKLSSWIIVDGRETGLLEIFYTSEKPVSDEGPFLSEERNLIDGITHLFSLMIKRKTAQDELQRARIEAESASTAKSEFLANMSHEIRTPMNAIIGMNYLLKKTELNPRQRDYVYKIDMSSQLLLGIINDILDLSKIEAGKTELEYTGFNLHDIIVNLSNMIGFKAQEKGLELIISIDDTIPMELKGDPLRLGQILLNLANNAVKFTENGEIVIEAVAEKISENKVTIKFSVRDTGIGMLKEEKDKLFLPFIQADASTTRKYGGTGLGLAICKRLVEMMNGTIGVDSEYGKGSVFYFTVELDIYGTRKERTHFPESLKNKKVLVADDNKTSCRVLSSYLEKLSFKAASVYSGEEVLEELDRIDRENEEPYSFIFLDWDMPGINGLETARIIIEKSDKDNLPRLIMVTGYEQEEIYRMANSLGLDGFIVKPVTSSTLLDVMTNALSHFDRRITESKDSETSSVDVSGLSGASILVVEDNEINREVAREILKDKGFYVETASNGLEAYRMLTGSAQGKYNLVLMDLQMPVMGGFEAARLIRKNTDSDALPIIAMTADVTADIRQKVSDSGMNGYISKPIDTGELFNSLLKFIQPDRIRSSAPALRAADNPASIPQISGLDINKGLNILGGNSRLYRKLILSFARTYMNREGNLIEMYENREIHKLKEFLHTLSGVSGNLGFTGIFQLASGITNALNHDESANIRSACDELASMLRGSINEVLSTTDTAENHQQQYNIFTKNIVYSLISLKKLLDTDHGEALLLIDSVLDSASETGYHDRIKKIYAAVNFFDIDRAKELIDSFLEELE